MASTTMMSERKGWFFSSSLFLLLGFVQHVLLLILVLIFLNKREVEEDEVAIPTMRDGDRWDKEKVGSSLLHLVFVLHLLLFIL